MYIIEVAQKEKREKIVLAVINQFFKKNYTVITQAFREEGFIFIDRSAKTKTEKISIEDITLFKQKLMIQSLAGEKLAIINHADQLTTQAQNALLKVLEEPPIDTIFLLFTADQRKMLPTILSRGISLHESEISHIHKDFLQDKITKIEYNEDVSLKIEQMQQFLRLPLYNQLLFVAKSLQASKESVVTLEKEDKVEIFILDLLTYYGNQLEKNYSPILIQQIFLIEECLKKVKKGVNSRLMLEYIILKLQTKNG